MASAARVAAVVGPRILLVRHGETNLNRPSGTPGDVVRGWSNPSLDAQGLKEVERLADSLAESEMAVLYCSPLTRAVQTARSIGAAQKLMPRRQPALLPWDMGEITGTSATRARPLLRKFAEERPKQPIPGGESFAKWRRRFLPWLKGLMQQVEHRKVTAGCVTHSRNLKLIEGWLAAGMKGESIDFDVLFDENTEPGTIFDFRPQQDGKWAGKVIGHGFVVK